MRNKRTDQILELCDQYMDRNSALPVSISQVKKWLNKEFDNKVDKYNKEHGTRKTTAEETGRNNRSTIDRTADICSMENRTGIPKTKTTNR